MSDSDTSCDACQVGAPRLSNEEIQQALATLPEWSCEVVDGVPQLVRQFRFKNFVDALSFANRLGEIAEREGHHPALLVEWGSLIVRWWTHKINGLHALDVKLSHESEALFKEVNG